MTPTADKLPCPFCDFLANRGTGRAAHVRLRHPKQYKSWSREMHRAKRNGTEPEYPGWTPNARSKSEADPEPAAPPIAEPAQEIPIIRDWHIRPDSLTLRGNGTPKELVQQALNQLREEHALIEKEIKRIEELVTRRDEIEVQVTHLASALKSLEPQPAQEPAPEPATVSA